MVDESDARVSNSVSGSIFGNLVQAGTYNQLITEHHIFVERTTGSEEYLDGWASREERLRAFVKAAAASLAESMRTEGSAGGPPDVSAVYAQQTVSGTAPGSGSRARARLSALEMLAGGGDCVVLGEPGSGKTTTLRAGAIELLQRWENGHQVPVFLRAGDLVTSSRLSVAVAAAVEAEVSGARPWSERFFRESPRPGYRWLLMVDGVDEVLSESQRSSVIKSLRDAARQPDSPYRVVLTSRPLHEGAFTEWPELSRYRLLALDKSSLADLARTRFVHAGLNDPDGAVLGFLRAISRTGIVKLSRVPLMATMLCELFIAERRGALPRSRSELFQRYTDLLHDRMYAPGAGGVVAQLTDAVAEIVGEGPARDAQVLLDRVRDVVGTVALAHQETPVRSALAEVQTLTAAARPSRMPEEMWRKIVRETFRRTGWLTQQGADLVFVHRHVGEFLAARRLVSDRRRNLAAFHRLFGWSGTRVPLMNSPFREEADTRKIEDQVSFCRFLISEWVTRPRTRLTLLRLARSRGARGQQNCHLLVMLVEDGTPLPANVRTALTRTLLELATKNPVACTRFEAALDLARLEDSRGFELLEQLAAGRDTPPGIRLSAATELARDTGRLIVPTLKALVVATELPEQVRLDAALEIARQNPAAAAVPLARLAHNKDLGPKLRLQAAMDLLMIDRERGQDALATLAGVFHHDPERHLAVAMQLARLGDPRAPAILQTLAGRGEVRFEVRLSAAVELGRLSTEAGAVSLRALATGAEVQIPNRLVAARALISCAPGLALDLMHRFATDVDRHPDFRTLAAMQLIEHGDSRGRPDLVELALELPYDSESKFDVLCALAALTEPLAIRELALMADEEVNPGEPTAPAAAKVLDHLVDHEELAGWGRVARDCELKQRIRFVAVGRLRQIRTVRARALLYEMSIDEELDPHVREAARKALA